MAWGYGWKKVWKYCLHRMDSFIVKAWWWTQRKNSYEDSWGARRQLDDPIVHGWSHHSQWTCGGAWVALGQEDFQRDESTYCAKERRLLDSCSKAGSAGQSNFLINPKCVPRSRTLPPYHVVPPKLSYPWFGHAKTWFEQPGHRHSPLFSTWGLPSYFLTFCRLILKET